MRLCCTANSAEQPEVDEQCLASDIVRGAPSRVARHDEIADEAEA